MLLHALLKHVEAEGLGTEGGSLFLGRAPQDAAAPAWEAAAKPSPRISANIKTKRKVAALFKSTEA